MLPALTPATVILALTLFTGGAPRVAPSLEPFCKDAKWFDQDLRKNGFEPDDEFTFKSGAIIKRYRFMGDVLWLAVLPDGRGCLLPMGMLLQPPLIHP